MLHLFSGRQGNEQPSTAQSQRLAVAATFNVVAAVAATYDVVAAIAPVAVLSAAATTTVGVAATFDVVAFRICLE